MFDEKVEQEIYDTIAVELKKGMDLPRNVIRRILEKYEIEVDELQSDVIIHSVSSLYAMKIHEWNPLAISFMHRVVTQIKERMKSSNIEVV